MCSRGCLAVGCACFLALTLCQPQVVLAEQGTLSGTSVVVNDTWVLTGSDTLTFRNCTILLQGNRIVLKDRAELRMSDCQVQGKGGILAYNDSKIDLTDVVWGEEHNTPVNLEAYGASSLRINGCGLHVSGQGFCPISIRTSGNVSIVSSILSQATQIIGGSLLVMSSTVVGCYSYRYPPAGLVVGGGETTILDSKFYGTGWMTASVEFDGDEIYLGSTSISSNQITIRSRGALTICKASCIEARSGGSYQSSDISLSASSMNISKSSISAWCWGDWWGHIILTGKSILIADSSIWSRGVHGETNLKLTGGAVFVWNSTLSATGRGEIKLNLAGSTVFVRNSTALAEAVRPGYSTFSDLSLAAEIVRVTHSYLKCTASRPTLRMEGNITVFTTEIRVIPPEDRAKNRWVILPYPALVLESDIGPGPEFWAYPSVAALLCLEPPGSCDEVFIDFSDIGGDSKFIMYDDGTHGDPEPGDGRYCRELCLPLSAREAVWSLPAWVLSGGRYSLQTITLIVPVPEGWVLVVALASSFWLKTSRVT